MASIPLTTATTSTTLPSLRLRSSPPLRRLQFNNTFKPLKSVHHSSISSFSPLPLSNLISKRHSLTVKASSASVTPAPSPAPPQPWQGAAIKPLLASIATGVILWFVPTPEGVSRNAWQLLAIFLGTIVGIITQPLPLGAVAILGLGVSVLTKTLPFAAAFSGFGDPIPWLICLAFFFAKGFIKTGLGNRVAYQFVSLFGSSSLGLGYSLVFSEALLAPAIPSVSMSKKVTASESEIKKLYDPETFYEHGDNPAFKKFMEIMVENVREGRLPDYRTYVVEKYTKFFYARNWDDFLHNDMKCFTFPRAMCAFVYSTWIFALASRTARNFLPIGQHGITRLGQTQFYHLYGPIGAAFVIAMPLAAGYIWYKTTLFTGKKFYYHVLLGERTWLHEMEKNHTTIGEYYFGDSPFSSDEAFPDLARGEMAKKKIDVPQWAQKK